jgi:hypothetical protein
MLESNNRIRTFSLTFKHYQMQFKAIISFVFFVTSFSIKAQELEIYSGSASGSYAGEVDPVQFFGKGFLDYGLQGQFQTTAQVLKINIGEPNGFYLPVSLLVGAANSDFSSNEVNLNTIMGLINPTGGAMNLSTNFHVKLYDDNDKVTRLKISGLLSGKLITGRNYITNESHVSPSGYLDLGVFFQTGAWTAQDEYRDGGIFWVQAKYSVSYLAGKDIATYFGEDIQGMPNGPRIEVGCYIKNRVNIKLAYYKALGKDGIPSLDNSQFRLALDYSVFGK